MKSKMAIVFRLLALALALILLLGAMPVSALDDAETAAEDEPATVIQTEDESLSEDDPAEAGNIDAEDETSADEEGEEPSEEETLAEDGTLAEDEITAEDKTVKKSDKDLAASGVSNEINEDTLLDGFYLIRPDWEIDDIDEDERFVKKSGEYMLNTDLSAGDRIKVVKVKDGEITTWYPDGYDNEYYVTTSTAGYRTIKFSPNYDSGWSDFGGYIFIVSEDDTEDDPDPDTTDPEIDANSVTYYVDGTEWNAEDDKDTWYDGTQTITACFEATDDDTDVASFWLDAKRVSAQEKGDDTYEVTISDKDNVMTADMDLTVKDGAGNESNTITIGKFNIDQNAPKKEDIISGVFSASADSTGQILNILSFGLYDKKDIYFTVTIDPKDGAPITDIKLIAKTYKADDKGEKVAGEEKELTPGSDKPQKNSDGYYTQTFKLAKATDGYAYELTITEIKDAAGNSSNKDGSADKNIKIADIPLSAAGSSTEIADTLSDIVVTDFKPYCAGLEKTGKSYSVGGDTVYTNLGESETLTIESTLTDELAGLDQSSISMAFEDTSLPALENVTVTPVTWGSDALSGKLIKATVSATVPMGLDSGSYTIKVEAKNNSGNEADYPYTLLLDNSAPAVANVTVNEGTWTSTEIKVDFKITDDTPSCGTKFVSVKATYVDGTEETLSASDIIDDGSGKYHFNAKKNGTYTITAKDNFDRESDPAEANVTKFDETAPVITITGYSNKDEGSEGQKWVADPVTVSFDIDDTQYGSGIVTDKDGETDYPFALAVTALDDEGHDAFDVDKKDITISGPDGEGKYTCSFTAKTQDEYRITVSDRAGNAAEPVMTEEIRYDDKAPEIVMVRFDKVTTVKKYGVYYNQALTGKVYVQCTGNGGDGAPLLKQNGNGIVITSENGLSVSYEPNIQFDDKNGLYYQEFTLNVISDKNNKKPYKLKFTAEEENGLKDTVENFKHTGTQNTIQVFAGDEQISGFVADLFEVVVTDLSANLTDFSVEGMGESVTGANNQNYYKGSTGTVSITIEDDFAGIEPKYMKPEESLSVSVNETSILGTLLCDAVFSDGTSFTGTTIDNVITKSNDSKLKQLKLTYKLENLQDKGVIPSGKYDFKLSVKNLAGNVSSQEFSLYVDNTAPEIKGFCFKGSGYIRDNKISGDNEQMDTIMHDPDDDSITYGYYFTDDTIVEIYVTDVIDDFEGSGVKEIYIEGTAYEGNNFTDSVTLEQPESNPIVPFTVPAGFKGRIKAYAVDALSHQGETKSPDEVIVEKEVDHPNHSGVSITVQRDNYVRKDNHSVDLFRGNVLLTFKAWDDFSGLRDVTFSVTGDSSVDGYSEGETVTLTNASELDKEWINNSQEKNIIKKITKQFTISANNFNCNNIEIKISGHDRAGNEIAEKTEKVSIDITDPTIQVEYSPATPTNTYNGENYYNGTRTATITVTERNFDPADFDVSKMVALEGSVPALVGSSNWSTGYDTYTDESTHIATVTFDADGKYQVEFDFVDMAGNHAQHYGTDTFYIDKTKPILRVTLSSSATPSNRYYNQTVTANISITEHNFSSDSAYLTYSPSATGPDNSSPATAPSISGWGGSGDEHTATITFASDGKYSFKIGFKDLATNVADDHSEPDFYVDTKIDKPEIKNVTSGAAYDGAVAPLIEYTDYNFDNNNYSYSLTRYAYDLSEMKQSADKVDYAATDVAKQFGRTVTYQNFPVEELTEGVYVLEAKYTDLAKNVSEPATVTFSVNRYGSVFLLGTGETEDLVEKAYTNNAPDVVIREINVNEVKDQSVSLSFNSTNNQLVVKKDYDITASGGGNQWHEYVYTLFNSNFDKEGEYSITVSSVDKFDNKITNRTANTESVTDRNCPVSFVVDKTAPVVSISGVDENGYYSDVSKTLSIVCTDDNIDKDSLVVMLDGQKVDLAETNAVVDDTLIGEIDIEYPVEADGKQTTHSVKVEVKDYADNSADDAVNAFTLSATFFTLFFHNTVALIVSGAVILAVIALAVILIIKKRGQNV